MNRVLESRRSSVSDNGSHLQDKKVSIGATGDQPACPARKLSVSSSTSQAHVSKRRSTVYRRPSLLDSQQSQSFLYRPKLANTYQMEPEKKFQAMDIEKVIYRALEERLEDTTYDAENCRFLVTSLANEIRHRVKQMGYARYKIVCTVNMGSVEEQGLRVASRCLWNKVHDSLSSATYKNASLFAVGTVFGVYYE